MSNYPSFMDFIKTASYTVGADVNDVPAKTACDAYTLYKQLYNNEDKVKIANTLYKKVIPGYDKIAMEMVATNILADVDREVVSKVAANLPVKLPSINMNKISIKKPMGKGGLPGSNLPATIPGCGPYTTRRLDHTKEKPSWLGRLGTAAMVGMTGYGTISGIRENVSRMEEKTNQNNLYHQGFNRDYQPK